MESAVTVVNGSAFVPARMVSETFGAKVNWDSHTKTVDIRQ
ncbi:copper amine oxidase N-terminal domain-containing protein [Paenibacillus chitinolyticus]|nr:copper amine oxidase N-terminal domain-containing protein [Paenibacillus chitinolyticus]